MRKGGFGRFALQRLLLLVPQLFAVVTIAFVVVRVIPGDPAAALLGGAGTEQSIRQLRRDLGIDKPIHAQYIDFLKGAVRGDLGTSWRTSQSVTDDISKRFPITLQLITLSMLFSVAIAIPLGVFVASVRRSRLQRTTRAVTRVYGLMAGAVPEFWLALLLVLVFFVTLRVAPGPFGLLDPGLEAPLRVTGFVLVDAVLAGNWPAFRSAAAHLVLPVATLTFTTVAPLLRMTTTQVSRALSSEYVRHARALGVPERTAYRYAVQTASGPILTLIGVLYAFLIGGAVLVDNIFALGGFGQYAVQGVLAADYPALLGFVTVAGTFAFVVYLLLDLAQGALDPRRR